MGFGDKLRGAMEKLRSATSLDKTAVKEAIKELQRALISADVEISLVLDLSKRIEAEAFKPLAAGISRREHIVKVTYDLLAEMLGGSETKVPEKPKRILLVGLFGSGKCVDGDSLVLTAEDGGKRIEDIFNQFKERKTKERDGFKIDLKEGELLVPSLNPNSLKIENKPVETVWKLKAPKELYEVSIDNGNAQLILTTPEHPFFVLEQGEVKSIRADKLKVDQFIVLPYKVPEPINANTSILNQIIEKMDDVAVFDEFNLRDQIRKKAYSEYSTLQECFGKVKIKASFSTFSHRLKNDSFIPLEYVKRVGVTFQTKKEFLKVKQSDTPSKVVKLPTTITPDLCEFIGYVLGDGHLGKNYTEISNEDLEIINRVQLLSRELFDINPSIKSDKRRKKLKRICLSSIIVTDYLQRVFAIPRGKKSAAIKLPAFILKQPKQFLKPLIRAYFDCDGHVTKHRSLELASASKEMIVQLQAILLRFGIAGLISEKKIKTKSYYRLILSGRSTEKFADIVGSLITAKMKRLKQLKQIGLRQGDGKKDMLPVGVEKLKSVRELFGQTIGEVQQTVTSYGLYESKGLISRNSLRKMLLSLESEKNKNWLRVLNAVKTPKTQEQVKKATGYSNGFLNALLFRLEQINLVTKTFSSNPGTKFSITAKGKELIGFSESKRKTLLQQLKLLAESDVFWAKVRAVKKVKPKKDHVFDLTVKDHHNFIANNTIVHNTTSTVKLAKYYSKRGLKTGVICADTFRPAAFEQLKQLAEANKISFYGNKKEKKAAKVVEEGLKEFAKTDLVIVDSAGRSALDDELVKEVKEINAVAKPDYTFLVLSADIGQVAKKQATAFHEAVGVNGVILTKTEGSAKGGGALAACHLTKAPVYFIGTGEKVDDFTEFEAQRFLSRVMGYGDLKALLDKVKEVDVEPESVEAMMKGEFNLQLFYNQLKAARSMGPLTKIMDMMGLKQQVPEEMMEVSEKKLDSFKFIMDSMTKQEKLNPEVLNKSRIERIAKGAGRKPEEVRELISHYKKMKKLFKQFSKIDAEKQLAKGGKLDMNALMQKFGKKKKKLKLR